MNKHTFSKKDDYCYVRYEQVVCLEAQIVDLRNQLSTLQGISNLDRSVDTNL